MFEAAEIGDRPFAGIRPDVSIRMPWRELLALGARNHSFYDNRSFRRGRAELVRRYGGTTGQILRSGGWSSNAFRAYPD